MNYVVIVHKRTPIYQPKFYGIFSTEKQAYNFGKTRTKQFDEEFDIITLLPIDGDIESVPENKDLPTYYKSAKFIKKTKSFFRKIFKGFNEIK